MRCAAWGTGYATEGSRALIAKGFAEFDVQRVVASTMAVNTGWILTIVATPDHLQESQWPSIGRHS
ncbi:GNAT family N-acetyltransferase [Arthrobacter oryzae]|uniref:GNAT family N-acetyltransferase n=1 Tax=Arthrobacter oryzae TaxID=409290 RepID=UPI0027D833A5|nr:GNAT family N-acetyltransferase [Arthrobacter oryzae]